MITHKQLIARDEKVEVDARRAFYDKAKTTNERVVK